MLYYKVANIGLQQSDNLEAIKMELLQQMSKRYCCNLLKANNTTTSKKDMQ